MLVGREAVLAWFWVTGAIACSMIYLCAWMLRLKRFEMTRGSLYHVLSCQSREVSCDQDFVLL